MISKPSSRSMAQLLVLLSVALVATTFALGFEEDKNLSKEALVADENFELSDEALGSIIKDFGHKISENMEEEVNKLLEEVEESKRGRLNAQELKRFKEANKALSHDAQTRIEMAGQKNKGEVTRSIVGDRAQSFLTQVSGRLQSAGAYIGQQMGTLARMAPNIKGKLGAIPGKLRKLMQWPTFLKYKIKFNKVYKSLREELYRQLVYLQTQTMVGVQNLKYLVGKTTYLLKATQFADITEREYNEAFKNPQAETEAEELQSERISLEELEQLKILSKEHRNIFGQNMDEALKHHQHAKNRRRRKRSLHFVENNDELDEDEEMEDALDDLPGAGDSNDEDVLANELMDTDEFKVVDDYAAEFDSDADTSNIDELDDVIDEALEEGKPVFKPIDLRETNCVPKPENQDRCGACYAYVTTAAATYFNCINQPEDQRKPERLNSRFLSDCGRYLAREGEPFFVNGCSGGKLTQAFNFTRQAGGYPFMRYEVARVSFNQYKSDTCAFPRPESIVNWAPVQVPAFQNTRVVYLAGLDQVDLHLRTVGPVFVNIRTWSTFRDQGSGIFDGEEESQNPIIHSMWLVGHDKDPNGRDYWILWNSHGTAWGEYGFLRIYSKSLNFYMVYVGGLMTLDAIKNIKG